MTVADLIKQLQALPQDLKVCVNDEQNGVFHEDIEDVFHSYDPNDQEMLNCVVIAVNV